MRWPRPRTMLVLACACVGGLSLAGTPADAQVLTFSGARRAVQIRADAYAHQRTRILSLIRVGGHAFEAEVDWTSLNPVGCKACGYDPNTGRFFDTPGTVYHAIALRSVCIGRDTAGNQGRPCRPRAYVTEILEG